MQVMASVEEMDKEIGDGIPPSPVKSEAESEVEDVECGICLDQKVWCTEALSLLSQHGVCVWACQQINKVFQTGSQSLPTAVPRIINPSLDIYACNRL